MPRSACGGASSQPGKDMHPLIKSKRVTDIIPPDVSSGNFSLLTKHAF